MDSAGLGTSFSMPRQSFGATANATAMGNSSFGFSSPAVRIPFARSHYSVVNDATTDTLQGRQHFASRTSAAPLPFQQRQHFPSQPSAAPLPFLGTPLPNWGGGQQSQCGDERA